LLCPNCFQEKENEVTCPFCDFNESHYSHLRGLPYRTLLANQNKQTRSQALESNISREIARL